MQHPLMLILKILNKYKKDALNVVPKDINTNT